MVQVPTYIVDWVTLSEHAGGMTMTVLTCTEGPAAPNFKLSVQSVVTAMCPSVGSW